MPGQTKYFISNTNGFFVNWYSDITGVESHGQALKASGNSGDDAVYVGQGTKVDATGLTSTGGNDSIYLTGTFNNYEQTLDGNTYTFKRTVTIGGTDYQEEVSFTASNGDRVYFANGFFKIDITGNDGLLNAGVFQKIKSTDIDSSSITPTDPLTSQPAIDKGTASEVGATKVFISDNNGEHITPGVKGSVFKISGNSGNDTVYVAKGTKVDATGLTSTGGNDVVYLTGTFNEYTKQTVVDSTYTFERTVNIGGTDYQEEVSFTASNGDRVYFANGFVKIDITGDDGLLEAGVFKRIISTDIDGSESTPGLGIGLSITDDLAETSIINKAKVGTDITYTFTFKDDVTGFDKNDIEVTGGTKGAFSGSGSVYSLVVSVTDNSTTDLFVGVAKDAAIGGGIGTKYASNSHKVDTVVPSKPISLDLATEDDSGTSNSDNLTNKTSNLTITGSAEVGDTIRLYNGTNTTAIGSEIVKANGTFSIDISLTQSTTPHSITARATDAAGNESLVSDALAITVDTTTATLTAQAMSVILGEDSNLVIDFSENIKAGTGNIVIHKASDNTIVETIAIDNSKISIANDKLTINPTADLTEGTYYIKMASGVITDMAGNVFAGITNLGADTTWAFETKALFTTIAWIGADDNYINDSEKDATALSGTVAGAGTLSITKIEFFEGSNTVGTAITSGLPAVAADGTWTLAHSAMPSELADGKTYTAVVTLSDGTNSTIITSTAVTYDIINPTPITTNPWTLSDIPAGQSAFKTGDVISLTLTMSETLKLNNTTDSKVVVAGKDFVLDKTASTTAGDKKLVFKYSVQAGDSIAATDFDIDNPTSDITLNNITDVAGNAPVFTADRVVLSKIEYIEKTGLGNNPFEGINVGDFATPTLADIDGDGDLDLVVGENYGALKYYQNTGTTSNPAYEVKTGDSNPFNGIDVGNYSAPTLADIDGDGDLDLVMGEENSTLKYYQNTGTTSNPAYEVKTGDDNPFNGINVGNYSAPTLADIDGDGDLDLVVGEANGTLKYYQNTGTTSNPAYEVKTGDDNPFNGIDVGDFSKPTLADIDGDGDLDLVVGEYYGTLKYYQNTGTTSNPTYEAKTGDSNPFDGINVGLNSVPVLADIDGDGDLDLVVGKDDGTLKYYYNQQPSFVDGQAPTLTTQASVILEETSDLVLDFSENIKVGTGSILIKNSSDVTVATINIASDTNKFSITNDKLTINIANLGLTNNKLTAGNYYLEMNLGMITDMAGNSALGITKDTNQWAFETKALSTTIAWIGADDNYINNTEKGTDLLSGVVISTTTTPTIEEIRFYEVTNGVTSSTAAFTIAKSNITQPATVSGVAKSWSITAANMPNLADGKTYIAKIDLKDGSTEVTKTSKAVTYDFTAPTVSSVVFTSNPGADKTYKAGDTVEITVTMSENTTVTDSPRIALLSGKYATYASGSGSDKLIFTYTVATGDTDANGLAIVANALNLNGGTLTDTAGNTAVITHAAVADNAEHMVDTMLPTLIISNNITGDAGINANITYTFSFGEAVINFDETDISVSNGKKGLFTKVSDTRYTLIVTQTGSANDITVSVATGAAKDSAGNLSISAQSVQTTDLERPTIAISMDNTNFLRNGDTATVTFDFSEELATDSFNLNDITTANGNLTNLSIDSTNLSRYTATYTAIKDIDSIHISFSITTGWTDIAGNTPAAPIQVSVTSEHQSSPILAVKQGEDQYLNATESTINIEIALQPDAKKDDKIQLKTSSKTLGNPYIITQTDIDNGKCLIEVNKAILGGDGTEVGIIAFMQYQSGNVSEDSNVLLITIDETPPLPIANSWWHINTPPTGQNAFKSGNLIELSLTTDEPLKFGNTAGSQLMMDDKVFTLDTFKSSATSNKQLVFTHQVQANETMARQQAVIRADEITLNGVTDLAGNTLDLSTLAETSLYSSAIFYQPSTHPFDSINTTNNATPTFADIDQDGDLDLIIGNATGTLSYYQNKNNSGTNSFTKITLNNPFQNIQHTNATPTFADIDQDGDLDLIVGAGDGKLYFYKNTQQSFNLVASNFNPFSHISIGTNATPTFADIDQDGDLDLIIGNTTGKLTYYKNTDNTFTKTSDDNNPFQNITHSNASPTFVDIDQDIDLDLVIGDSNGKLHYYYRNTNGVFTVQTGSNNPIANIAVSNNAKPTFADIDSNGTLDLIIGDQNGLQYYQRQHSEVIDTIAPRVTLLIKNTTLLKGESTQVIFNFSEAVKGFSLSNLSADNATFSADNATLGQLKLNPNRHSTQPFSYIATLTPTDDINKDKNRITVNTNWHDLNGNTPAASLTLGNYQVFTDTNRIKPKNWESDQPPSEQEAFAQGDTITITLTLTGNIKVDNKVDNEQAYLIISGKRFEVDKAAFDGATDKTVLTFTYTVQAGDTLGLSDFVVDKEQVFLTGVTDASDNAIDIATMPDQVQLGLGGQGLFKLSASLTLNNDTPTTYGKAIQQFYADINADGYMDVISTHGYASTSTALAFYFFQGSADGLQFKEGVGTPLHQWDSASTDQKSGGSLNSASFADVDGDGDLDMFVAQLKAHYDYIEEKYVFSHHTNVLKYFENQNGSYTLQNAHSLSKINITGVATPTFADIDADGDPDAIIGDTEGGLHYFTNHQGVFTQQTGENNPFTMDVGTISAPAFADVDADGDLDLLIGSSSGWHYYKNINNIWKWQTPENNPFNNFKEGTPNFVDVDFDGKMDLVVTTEYKTYYYHNIQHPVIDTTPPEAPLIKIHDTSLATGDTTLVEFHFKEKVLDFTTDDITAENASLSGFGQNTGLGPFVWTAILTPDTGITDSINTLTIGTDWHDAAGNKPSQPSTSVNYKVIDQNPPTINTDTSANTNNWVFNTPPTGQEYFSIGDTMTLTLTVSEAVQVADTSAYITVANKRFNINKTAFDSSTDKTKLSFDYTVVKGDHLIIGDFIVNNTHLTGVTNAAGVTINNLTTELALLKNSDAFERKTGTDNPFSFIGGHLSTTLTSINLIDLDNDTIPELAYNANRPDTYSSGVLYYKNTATPGDPIAFTPVPQDNNPFKNTSNNLTHTFADMDQDGDLDLLTNNHYYKNNNGTFVKIEGNQNPFANTILGNNTMHALVDLDNDGDIDLVTSNFDDGILSYYENNNGTYTIESTHPLTGLDLGKNVQLNFKDLDGDGDLDLISGSDYNKNNGDAISYYKNIGTINTPVFARQQGDDNFFNHTLDKDTDPKYPIIRSGSPALGDINGDGILDFVSSKGNWSDASLYYAQGTTPIIKVKTTHHQDMDAITTYTASDKLTEHFNWNGLTPDNKYSSLKDATITNFDLFNDTLNISYALKHLDENAKLGAITLSKSGQDSTLSIGSFDITLTAVDINTTNLSHLVDTGTILI